MCVLPKAGHPLPDGKWKNDVDLDDVLRRRLTELPAAPRVETAPGLEHCLEIVSLSKHELFRAEKYVF